MARERSTVSRGLRVADVSWPEVANRAERGAVGVLPVGAASKQHGRHLPMNTDWLQAEWLVTQLVRRAEVLVWPTLAYGYYPAFTDYPGSTSLSEATFAATVGELLRDIGRAGVTRCLILNTGVSTTRPLGVAVGRTGSFDDVRLANVYSGPRFRAVEAAVCGQPRGGHADEIETSILLAIKPQAVDMSRAEPWAGCEIHGRFSRSDPGSPNYSPSGVFGDPTLATAEKGVRLLQAMLGDVLAMLAGMSALGLEE